MSRGFTLIEVLVALMIFALISAMAFRGLSSLAASREAVEKESGKWRDVSQFFARIGDDLGHASRRPARDRPPFSGGGSLSFIRAESGQGELRIGYRLEGNKVEELVWAHPDSAPAAHPEIYPLLSGVKSFALRFLAQNNAWLAAWPIANQPFPRAVEVTLVLDSGEKLVRIFPLT